MTLPLRWDLPTKCWQSQKVWSLSTVQHNSESDPLHVCTSSNMINRSPGVHLLSSQGNSAKRKRSKHTRAVYHCFWSSSETWCCSCWPDSVALWPGRRLLYHTPTSAVTDHLLLNGATGQTADAESLLQSVAATAFIFSLLFFSFSTEHKLHDKSKMMRVKCNCLKIKIRTV